MSGEISKLKLMRMSSSEKTYKQRYPKLAAIADRLDDTLLVDRIYWDRENPIATANLLDFSKWYWDDVTLISPALLPTDALHEELERLVGFNVRVIVRLVRIDEHRLRTFYYFRQSDQITYTMVYSAILDDREQGLVGEINLNDKIVTKDKGFHPGVISISTFEPTINAIKSMIDHGIASHYVPTESFAFKKKVPLHKRHTHHHYEIIK